MCAVPLRTIEQIRITQTLDPWFTLGALSRYSGLSIRSLRAYLSDPTRPLPHYRMRKPHVVVTRKGKNRTVSGKILVRSSEFEKWMEAYHYIPARATYAPALDIDHLVDEVVAHFRPSSKAGS